jgi:hypothetical protein
MMNMQNMKICFIKKMKLLFKNILNNKLKMNNEELLSIYFHKYEDIFINGLDNPHEIINNTEDIVEKSFMFIAHRFRLESLMYSMPCLFFRNGQWYKYSVYNPGPIQLNNATQLNNEQFLKFIKRNLLTRQKQIILNKFLKNDYELNLENLNMQKRHLNIYKNLNIDSEIYNNIKVLLEYSLTIDETDITL